MKTFITTHKKKLILAAYVPAFFYFNLNYGYGTAAVYAIVMGGVLWNIDG